MESNKLYLKEDHQQQMKKKLHQMYTTYLKWHTTKYRLRF